MYKESTNFGAIAVNIVKHLGSAIPVCVTQDGQCIPNFGTGNWAEYAADG